MKLKKFNVIKTRFHLHKENMVILQGFFSDTQFESGSIEVFLDGEKLSYTMEKYKDMEIRQRYLIYDIEIQAEHVLYLTLPEGYQAQKKLSVFYCDKKGKELSFQIRIKALQRIRKTVEYNIDAVTVSQQSCTIKGWHVFSADGETAIRNRFGHKVPYEISYHFRNDLRSTYRELDKQTKAGFEITVLVKKWKKLKLILKDRRGRSSFRIPVISSTLIQKLFHDRYIGKGFLFLQKHGLWFFLKRVWIFVEQKYFAETEYEKIRKKSLPDDKMRKLQSEKKFASKLKFSIVVPLFETPLPFLKAFIDSVQKQTYQSWELCLSDGSGKNSPLTAFLDKIKNQDSRIKVISSDEKLPISENTNRAIAIAAGDFIIFADHDDLLSVDALFECAKAYNENTDTELIYSDEDKISMNGKKYFEPHFKPDFNIDLLRSMNYFCHLVAVKKSLQEQVGLLDGRFNGAQDYDFVLRCIEKTKSIYHIPKVLYHWRAHINSTAENPESKRYAFEAGRRAVKAHYDRCGIPAEVLMGQFPGLYRTKYKWQEQPLVSIIIPNKDHIEDLAKCLASIDQRSTYQNYEFIIVENNSEHKETFQYYEKLQLENQAVTVVYWEHDFNYSQINNFGAEHAKGDYLLLLNNDTQMINGDCLWELLSVCMRDDVGIVGARLYYDDDTIQHAGVVIGFGGIAGHTFIGSSRYENGYFSRIITVQDYSAVTAACMMTKKEIFFQVNGLTDELKVAFNDIDYCLKVREAGKLVVYNPYAELYHFESKSRGLEDSPEKLERFYKEMNFFVEKWAKLLEKGDPYYNPNLTLAKADFSLKRV